MHLKIFSMFLDAQYLRMYFCNINNWKGIGWKSGSVEVLCDIEIKLVETQNGVCEEKKVKWEMRGWPKTEEMTLRLVDQENIQKILRVTIKENWRKNRSATDIQVIWLFKYSYD
jgi:hypothetical protein